MTCSTIIWISPISTGRPNGRIGSRRGWRRARRSSPASSTRTRTDRTATANRSEEHTSELQSLMRHTYAVFRLKKKNQIKQIDREIARVLRKRNNSEEEQQKVKNT